jgi:hypothetical protein
MKELKLLLRMTKLGRAIFAQRLHSALGYLSLLKFEELLPDEQSYFAPCPLFERSVGNLARMVIAVAAYRQLCPIPKGNGNTSKRV